MRLRYPFIAFLLFFTINCGKKNDTTSQQAETTPKADSLVQLTDSLAKIHRGFVGSHAHPMSLKVHAHQDPSKKARIFKRQAKAAPARIKAMKKANKEREKRIQKALEEKDKND